MYVDDSLLASNTIAILNALKQSLAKKYNIKDLEEVKTVIGWLISQDTAIDTIKICQSVFIRYLVYKDGLIECNTNVILIKAGFTINIKEPEDYDVTNLQIY